jgi:hypothetical protein
MTDMTVRIPLPTGNELCIAREYYEQMTEREKQFLIFRAMGLHIRYRSVPATVGHDPNGKRER